MAGLPMIELGDGWRVAYDPLQWILQQRQGDRWRGHSFCCTRAALLRCIRDHCGDDITPVLRLPEWHPDRAVAATKAEGVPTPPAEPLPGPVPPPMPVVSGFTAPLQGDDYRPPCPPFFSASAILTREDK
jgi:hypothetical protein